MHRPPTPLDQRLAFEAAITSTPEGRRSLELRQRAFQLAHTGRQRDAFQLYAEAARLHPDDDPGPAAAMCWYDLAETYTRRPEGVRAANLRAAEALLRRALRSPAVERDPHRAAMVRDSLASCLRHLAEERPFEAHAPALLAEARQLFEQAVAIAERCGRVGWEGLAGYLHNLGNLEAQCDNLDKAVLRMSQAEGFARGIAHAERPDGRDVLLASALVHGAQYRHGRARPGDREAALKMLAEAERINHPAWVHRAQLARAAIFVDGGAATRDQLIAELRRVRPDQLSPSHLRGLIHLHVRAGLRHEALQLLHGEIRRAIEARRDTMADHAGDSWAEQAQQAAHLAARLHVEDGDALEAFITLEHTSGMRFTEVLDVYSVRPESIVARAVQERFRRIGAAATMVEDLANRLAMVPGPALPEAMRTLREAYAEGPGDEDLDVRAPIVVALATAEAEADPIGALRRRAGELQQRAMRVSHALFRLDATTNPLHRPWMYRFKPELIRDLLRAHPNLAIVRVSLADDMLVIGLWLDGDDLVARAHRIEVPPELFAHLHEYQDDPESAPVDAVAAELAGLDLSPALPPEPMEHVVILPSYVASFLPLGALGPSGCTLLDRFRSLSWMPCLSPLFDRQAPHPPRAGVVSVAPGETKHHAVALRIALPGEHRLEREDATVAQVVEAARHADVMCFYTHGQHAGDHGPELHLTGGPLRGDRLDGRWKGMERVELWACQTGVSLPSDPLTPPVDETFGMDSDLLRAGVRSAIGTLWKVPDLVTAVMVHHYRRRLGEGALAPRALADAQRWWRDEGARLLEDHLRRTPSERTALQTFAETLGAPVAFEDADVDAFLGPVLPGARSRAIERLVTRLVNPLSWAGFRFVGVAERRPARAWTADDERPLTPEEEAEVERILAEAEVETPDQHLDDWQEERLARATTLAAGAHPSPDQAIEVARQYRDRVSSSHPWNLLAGLAWLHEALATLDATERDGAARLCLEAAWLWVEVARGEVLERIDLLLARPAPVAILRARELAHRAGNTPHVRVLRAWIDLLESDVHDGEGLDAALKRAWTEAEPAVAEAFALAEDYDSLRTLAAAGEILLVAPDALRDAGTAFVARARDRVGALSWSYDIVGAGIRLQSVVAVLQRRLDLDDDIPLVGRGMLAPPELAREAATLARKLWHEPVVEGLDAKQAVNDDLDALEGALWGWPDDDRTSIWAFSGTLGAAYRRLAGLAFAAFVRSTRGDSMATQVIACLQPLADLRVTLLSRWMQMVTPEHPSYRFWLDVRDREASLEALEAAALLPELDESSPPSEARPQIKPHRLDPFRYTGQELQRGCTGPQDLVPWALGRHAEHVPPETPATATAAFRVTVESAQSAASTVEMWRALCGVGELTDEREATSKAPDLPRLFDPKLRLADREDWLRRMPPGVVILGVTISVGGELIAAATWNTGAGLEQRVHMTSGPTGWHVRHLLAGLHAPQLADGTTDRGTSASRRETWATLQRELAPVLDAVLGPALAHGALGVAVMAPGSLRPLPWLGLLVGGRPLHACSLGVMLLPSLGWEPQRSGTTGEACLLGREREEGDTSFGEAAVETLRRWFEPRVIRPPRERTTTITEVDQLDPIAPTLRTLRLYGVGNLETISPAVASLNIEGRRKLADWNTRGLVLKHCEVVELWAATAGSGPHAAILHDDCDRIPGLVRSFLLCGAGGVLDLAWPIHDLVKAIVCERFGTLHRTDQTRGPEALGRAVAWTADLLERWRADCKAPHLIDALGWLDEARRVAARDAGRRDADVIPFAGRADAPSVAGRSAAEVIEEACSPVHLAAFRFWGWFQG
jgi:tetratricopeptide (TPR) repeat protein